MIVQSNKLLISKPLNKIRQIISKELYRMKKINIKGVLLNMFILISSLESYPGGCLGQSLTHSLSLSLNFTKIKVKMSLSVQCVAAEIRYSSQILQSCSKLG